MTTTHVRAYNRTSTQSDARLKHDEHHPPKKHKALRYARKETRKAGRFLGYEGRKFGRWVTGKKKKKEAFPK